MRNFLVSMIVLLSFATKSTAQTIIPQSGYVYNTSGIPYVNYTAPTLFLTGSSVGVMGLTLKDTSTDNLRTTLTSITFSISALTGNAISTAGIYANGSRIDTMVVVNGATSIAFTHGTFPSVHDDSTLNLELRVRFKTTITDNQQMQFTVSSVSALATGSQFSTLDGGGATSVVSGNANKLSVIADRFKFATQPSDVFAGQIISPSVAVKAVDKNNNIDVDYVTPIKLDITNSIPSCDTLAGNLVTPVAGLATFPALIPNVAEFGVTLKAIGFNNISNSFDVNSALIKTLINWNFTDGNTVADGGTNSNYLTKNISTSATGVVGYGSCGCIGDHNPGAYSTGWDIGSGNKFWQIDFSPVGYWSIKVSSRQRSSPTGPANFKVQYKTGSGAWTDMGSSYSLADSFRTNSATLPELDSSVTQVYVRWLMNSNTSVGGGTVDNAGQNFIDDINITGVGLTLAKQLNYRSKSSGTFESSCNWESASTPAGPWTQAHGSPDFTAYGIEIQPGHTIAINQTVRIDQVVVDPGATLILNNGQLFISGGGSVAGTSGLIVKGTFIDNTSGTNVGLSFSTGNSWRLDSFATFIKTGNSNPRTYRDFYYNGMSTIPSTVNWIIRYIGGANYPSFTTDSTFYPNLTFESTSGPWNPITAGSYFSGTTASGAFATIKGNLDIGGTGNLGTVNIRNVSANSQPMLVQGNTFIRSGSELSNIVTTTYGTGFEIQGSLSVEGILTVNGGGTGTLKMSGSALQTISGAGTINLQDLSVTNTGAGIKVTKNLTVGGIDSLILGVLDPGVNTLTLSGPIVRTAGSINGKSATIVFKSTGLQRISANTFVNNSIDTFIVSGNVVIDAQDTITSALIFQGSNNTLFTNINLTLKSTATRTANVGVIANGNGIVGAITVERYISAKRAWRFLAVSTNTTQTIKEAWQEGASSSSGNFVPGYGTQITNQSAAWAVNGFDNFSPDGPSLKKYKFSNDSWVGILSTNNGPAGTGVISTTEGLMTFIRGDRTSMGAGATPHATILRTTGPLKTGPQAPITVSIDKFASIGNPYASTIDLRQITSKTGIDDFFYVWDPYLANSNGIGFGAYQTLGKTLLTDPANYYAFPGGGSYPVYPSATSNYIESGQAFFVHSFTGGTLTIDESAKGGPNTNPLVFRPVSIAQQRLRTNLYAIETNGTATMVDATLNDLSDNYRNEVDQLDAKKTTNVSENLAIKNGGNLLAIERKHTIGLTDTIQFNMLKMKVKSYKFEIIGSDFTQPGLTAFLEDSYFNTRTKIDLNGNTIFKFNVINVPGSWNPTRFRIVFKDMESGPLPVTFSIVKASQQDKNIAVEWKVETEKNIKEYVVEKSTNGQHFIASITVTAKNNNSSTNYQWIDNSPSLKNNYYRIKSIGVNGEIQYSNVVKVFMGAANPGISIYPNPVVDGVINLQLTNQPKGIYALKLLNKSGQVVQVKQIDHSGGTSTEAFRMNKALAHGTYHLEITSAGNSRSNINILYQ